MVAVNEDLEPAEVTLPSSRLLLDWDVHRRSRNPGRRQLNRSHSGWCPGRNLEIHPVRVHQPRPSNRVDRADAVGIERRTADRTFPIERRRPEPHRRDGCIGFKSWPPYQ